MKRALVAIGVDKTATADFRPLSAAAAGAREFSDWARHPRQGYEVELLTDSEGPVGIATVFDAITRFVSKGVYEQLVVYFSGHGILLAAETEVWLLSGALANPNEAVNVSASIAAARTCGIPHVVFISDACRSLPANFRMGAMTPGSIFPAKQPRAPGPEVDVFYATLPGDTALEVPPDEAQKRHRGIFTDCLLKALRGEASLAADRVKTESGFAYFVGSRLLKSYLIAEVPKAAAAVSIQLVQDPDARVESAPPKYLAEVDPGLFGRLRASPLSERLQGAWRNWTSSNDAEVRNASPDDVTMVVPDFRDIRDSVGRIIETAGRPAFETRTGFTFSGVDVRSVRTTNWYGEAALFEENGAMHARVYTPESAPEDADDLDRVSSRPKAAALIRFADGSGIVLSVIAGYIGTVVVESGRVLTVNYTPSEDTRAWFRYQNYAAEIEWGRALAATLARHGNLRFEGGTASAIAERLRRYKLFDPTLGLFASYAYAQAGNGAGVLSIYRYMDFTGIPAFFDVAMLAAQSPDDERPPFPPPIARPFTLDFSPWMPLLTQGWLLLGRFEKDMPVVIRKAKRHLIPGLWTTFAPEGLDILQEAFFGETESETCSSTWPLPTR